MSTVEKETWISRQIVSKNEEKQKETEKEKKGEKSKKGKNEKEKENEKQTPVVSFRTHLLGEIQNNDYNLWIGIEPVNCKMKAFQGFFKGIRPVIEKIAKQVEL